MIDRTYVQKSRQIRDLRQMELLDRQTDLADTLRIEAETAQKQHEAQRRAEEAHQAWSQVLDKGGFSPDMLRLNSIQLNETLRDLSAASRQTRQSERRSETMRQRCAEAQARRDIAVKLQSDLEKRAGIKREARLDHAVADLVTQRWRRT